MEDDDEDDEEEAKREHASTAAAAMRQSNKKAVGQRGGVKKKGLIHLVIRLMDRNQRVTIHRKLCNHRVLQSKIFFTAFSSRVDDSDMFPNV